MLTCLLRIGALCKSMASYLNQANGEAEVKYGVTTCNCEIVFVVWSLDLSGNSRITARSPTEMRRVVYD